MTPSAFPRSSTVPPSHRPAVLAVDDVEANLIALRALLEDLDCEVVLAKSGNEALRQLLRRQFAVVLLDVQMPGMDGYEVLQHARKNPKTRDVPIIFLTAASDSEKMVLRGYGSGAVDFLVKPLNPVIFRGKVRGFLDLHAAQRKLEASKAVLERTNAELSAAYAELKATHAQLVQAAKMASLGELVAGVAHEINNPLAFVSSHLETARRSLAAIEPRLPEFLDDDGRRHFTRALARLRETSPGLERISDLVVKLRTFSRLDEGERKLVDVRECVESVLTILGHRLKDEIVVETAFSAPREIDCYASLLNQAIMNLVCNAIDAMDGAGTLRIEAGADAVSGDYRIAVTDDGPGIPPELRERVLEPFFTTKPVGAGTGLGLSITYSIVQKHGGMLELLDAENRGTSAVIRIPQPSNEQR